MLGLWVFRASAGVGDRADLDDRPASRGGFSDEAHGKRAHANLLVSRV